MPYQQHLTATQSPLRYYRIRLVGHLRGCSCEEELQQQNLTVQCQNNCWEYVYPVPSTTSSTTTPAIRYFFSISLGQPRTTTDPPMLWPTSFEKAINENSSVNKNIIFTKKVGQFDGSGKRVWSISQKSATRTSIDRSSSTPSVEDVFPKMRSREKFF